MLHNTNRKVYKIQMYIIFKTETQVTISVKTQTDVSAPEAPMSPSFPNYNSLSPTKWVCVICFLFFSFPLYHLNCIPKKYRLVGLIPELDINGILCLASFTNMLV